MKRAKREDGSNSIDRILELPKEILQRILSSLTQEEAVRTSVLSKSWRYIWCTRPNLDLSDDTFIGNKQDFLTTVDKTLRCYCDQRLCLEKFRLCISLVGQDYSNHEWVPILEKWIPLLTTMGVKDFQLSIVSDYSRGIIDLPSVVFEAESLELLHLQKCNLGQKIPENIPFVRLQELRLDDVLIKQEIFDKIISSCPMLTTLRLQFCKGLKTIKLEKKFSKHLKHFFYMNGAGPKCSIEIDIQTLETMEIMGSKIRFHTLKFSNLKSLTLDTVEISSDSIEQSELLCIDAPNIECFHYTGSFIPSISFAPTCRKSILKVFIRNVDDAQSWFLRLSKLLQALRRSKIFLNIVRRAGDDLPIADDILVQNIISGGDKPVVMEQLGLSNVYVPSLMSFLYGLFCICHPRNVYPNWSSQGVQNKERKKKKVSELFCRIQMMRVSGNRKIWQDLEELTIGGSDRSLQQWQLLKVSSLSESSALEEFTHFRVQFKWRENCESS